MRVRGGLKPCLSSWKSCGLAGAGMVRAGAGTVRAKALPEYVEVLRTGGAGTVRAKALPEYVEVG